jgi:hypothetical protein
MAGGLGYYQRESKLLRTFGHRRGEAFMLNNIGVAYLFLGEFDKGRKYLAEALPLFVAAKDRLAAGKALSSMAKGGLLLGDAPGARLRLDAADVLLSSAGDARSLAETLNIHCELRLAEAARVRRSNSAGARSDVSADGDRRGGQFLAHMAATHLFKPALKLC